MSDDGPESYRAIEKDARQHRAEIAGMMLRRPGWRWLLRPIHKLFTWIAAHCDRILREDGWR